MTSIPYTLGHGLENRFYVVEEAAVAALPSAPDLARRWCAEGPGGPADGVLVTGTGPGDRPTMTVYNADGSIAEMCGNGIRVLARALVEHGDAPTDLVIDTGAGPREVHVTPSGDGPWQVRVHMGPARFDREAVGMLGKGRCDDMPLEVRIAGRPMPIAGSALSLGNPHFVIYGGLGYADPEMAARIGPLVESHDLFPNAVNVSFAETAGPAGAKVVVWERGSGLTQACGTGACATAAAGARYGYLPYDTDLRIELPGGPLTVRVDPDASDILMTGPAVELERGEGAA